MLRLVLAVVVAATWSISAAVAQPNYDRGLVMHQLLHDDEVRIVGVYTPNSYRPGAPAPLIVALHVAFSSPQAFHAQSGLAAVAEEHGALIVYPQTLEGVWADGGHAALNRPTQPANDAGFIEAAIAAVDADHPIDRSRIHLVGFGAGGLMSYRLICDGRLPISGAVVVNALLWDFQRDQCASPRPTPLLVVHGRRNEYAPVNGGDAPGTNARRLGVNDTLAFWRRVNGCGERADVSGRDGSSVFSSCTGAPLAYVGVSGGNQDWFHTGAGYELNRQGVDATALAGAFLFNRPAFALPQARSGGGRARAWIVYAPSGYDPTRPTPVVVLLHGRPSNGGGMAHLSGMNDVAENRNFIVVYPDGIDNEWNAQFDIAASDVSLSGRSSTLPQDDVGFLKTLMRDLAQDFNVDPSRLYLGGFSNGAFMTYRMACSASDTFAAFAAVGANLYVELSRLCSRSDPSAILIMNGTADPSVPYGGVEVVNPRGGEPIRISMSVQNTVAAFARRNRCSLAGTSTTFAERGESPGTHVVRFIPRDCRPGADIAFYVINGGGHTWPGRQRLGDGFGPTNMDIDAGEVIWDFFSQHTLAPGP